MTPGEKALEALRLMNQVAALGDFIYDVREREGKGWDGPRVKQYGAGCDLMEQAFADAGIDSEYVPEPEAEADTEDEDDE